MDDLVAWLRAQLDEDERVARAVPSTTGRWRAEDSGLIRDSDGGCIVHDDGEQDHATAEHIARHDPARVLREVEAKRRIVAWHQLIDGLNTEGKSVRGCGNCIASGALPPYLIAAPCLTLRLLALPYADREGFREEWRP